MQLSEFLKKPLTNGSVTSKLVTKKRIGKTKKSMPKHSGRLFWGILFWISMGFFALCVFLIYVLKTKLGMFDTFLGGIAFAIGVFSFQNLQGESNLEETRGDLMVELYGLQKQHEFIRDLIESKCGGEEASTG